MPDVILSDGCVGCGGAQIGRIALQTKRPDAGEWNNGIAGNVSPAEALDFAIADMSPYPADWTIEWQSISGVFPAFGMNVANGYVYAQQLTSTPGLGSIHAFARSSQYRWAVMRPTCYAKVWWELRRVRYRNLSAEYDNTLISAQLAVPTMPSENGICLPAGDDWIDDSESGGVLTGWVKGVLQTEIPSDLPPEQSGVTGNLVSRKIITKVRWSFVAGYEPASADPASQGFPP